VGSWTLVILRPVLRYSVSRDAHVLRVIGGRWGPVLVSRRSEAPWPMGPAGARDGLRED
jgi:hypothetical protein